jgi:hypothetical protein
MPEVSDIVAIVVSLSVKTITAPGRVSLVSLSVTLPLTVCKIVCEKQTCTKNIKPNNSL